ncbi:hypothetical protein DMN98_24635 [Vibrio parahaemolyticus]|nr:hypothetical protein [Vibrio parahaemolyticus]
MSNATTKPNHTSLNTKPNEGMKNAMRWESVLNALLADFVQNKSGLNTLKMSNKRPLTKANVNTPTRTFIFLLLTCS